MSIRRVIAGAAGAVVVWQAVAGAIWLGARFVEDVRTEGMFDSEAERVARALGPHAATLELLRARVPEYGVLFCNLTRSEGQAAVDDALLFNRLRHALHPRFVLGLDFRDPRLRATLQPTQDFYVCDFRPGSGIEPPAPLRKLAETDLVELWGYEGSH